MGHVKGTVRKMTGQCWLTTVEKKMYAPKGGLFDVRFPIVYGRDFNIVKVI